MLWNSESRAWTWTSTSDLLNSLTKLCPDLKIKCLIIQVLSLFSLVYFHPSVPIFPCFKIHLCYIILDLCDSSDWLCVWMSSLQLWMISVMCLLLKEGDEFSTWNMWSVTSCRNTWTSPLLPSSPLLLPLMGFLELFQHFTSEQVQQSKAALVLTLRSHRRGSQSNQFRSREEK